MPDETATAKLDADDTQYDTAEFKALVDTSVRMAEQNLSRGNGDLLNRLRQQDQEDLLEARDEERIKLGRVTKAVDPAAADWRRGARYLRFDLSDRLSRSEDKLDQTRHALIVADRWHMAADLLSVFGPAAIFAVLKVEHRRIAEYMSASFALAALFVTAVGKRVARDPFRNTTYQNSFMQLVHIRAEAAAVARQLDANLHARKVTRKLVELLRHGNCTCQQLGEVLD